MMVCVHCGSWVRVKGTHLCYSCCASCCCCCLSFFSCCCPATQQDWLGGMWDSGDLPCVLKSTTNNIHHLLFGCHITIGDVAPGFHDVGSQFHWWVAISFHRWLFAFVGSCFHLQVVICIHGQSLSFAGSCFGCSLLLVMGSVCWLLLAASLCSGYGDKHGWWWWKEESGHVW